MIKYYKKIGLFKAQRHEHRSYEYFIQKKNETSFLKS